MFYSSLTIDMGVVKDDDKAKEWFKKAAIKGDDEAVHYMQVMVSKAIAGWTDIVAISAFYHIVGLKADGTVVAVGVITKIKGKNYLNDHGQLDVENWTEITAIATGTMHTVGLKADGTVVAVGDNSFGQLDVDDWANIVAISAKGNFTVGLKSDGTVVAVGDNSYGQLNVDDWKNITHISAGVICTVGLMTNGEVVIAFTETRMFKINKWKEISAISAGALSVIGLKYNGSVNAVGDEDRFSWKASHLYAEFAPKRVYTDSARNWTDIIVIAAGYHQTVGLKSDGTVVALCVFNDNLRKVGDWKDIIAIEAGYSNTIGLKKDGTVVITEADDYVKRIKEIIKSS